MLQAEPIFKEPSKFSELVDPLLKDDYPKKSFNQAVAVAAMCLQDDASIRPLMRDVVTALSYLSGPETGLASAVSSPSPSPCPSPQKNEITADERKRAVAEAIEWGSNSRNNVKNLA